MRKKDIVISVVLGVLTAFFWIIVVSHLLKGHGALLAGLFILFPVIFVFGLYVGKWLSRWKPFFEPFSKFVMIGFLNSGIDFAIFNLLIYLTGKASGPDIVLFKSISFIIALINSYAWNKYWVFETRQASEQTREFFSYVVVTVIGFVINVGIVALIANTIEPPLGLSQIGWDNIAAAIATIANLLSNYLGYHFIVFKPKTRHA
jgi:putative flippase GtrA